MQKTVKERLANRELTIGSWIQIGDPTVAEIMAKAGFDWLAIDMEHSSIGIEKAQSLIRVIDLSGVPPLVRVSGNDPVLIQHVLDAGACGIIVPNVNSPESAEAAVQAAHYPPSGTRGVGLWRAQEYGFGFEKYWDRQTAGNIVIVQIEHIEAVDHLEAIIQTKGVDGFLIGPYDLSASLGIPGQFDHPDFRAALDRVHRVSRKTHALMGTHIVMPDVGAAREKINEGYRLIAFGIDTLFLGKGCREGLGTLRSFYSEQA